MQSPSVQPSQGTPTRRPSSVTSDDLMAEHDRELRRVDLAVAQVQVGAAHPAGAYAQQQLVGPRLGIRQRGQPERLTRSVEHDGAHD